MTHTTSNSDTLGVSSKEEPWDYREDLWTVMIRDLESQTPLRIFDVLSVNIIRTNERSLSCYLSGRTINVTGVFGRFWPEALIRSGSFSPLPSPPTRRTKDVSVVWVCLCSGPVTLSWSIKTELLLSVSHRVGRSSFYVVLPAPRRLRCSSLVGSGSGR